MEISHNYFEKYFKATKSSFYLEMKEKDKIWKRNWAKSILVAQSDNSKDVNISQGDVLFKDQQERDSIFLVKKANVDIITDDNKVLTCLEGNLVGKYATLMHKPRNCLAVCSTPTYQVNKILRPELRQLLSPDIKTSFLDLCLWRDFKKAFVHCIASAFPYGNPRAAWNACITNTDAVLTKQEINALMKDFSPNYNIIKQVLQYIKLTKTDFVTYYLYHLFGDRLRT